MAAQSVCECVGVCAQAVHGERQTAVVSMQQKKLKKKMSSKWEGRLFTAALQCVCVCVCLKRQK